MKIRFGNIKRISWVMGGGPQQIIVCHGCKIWFLIQIIVLVILGPFRGKLQ
jgi:hypothetical protein